MKIFIIPFFFFYIFFFTNITLFSQSGWVKQPVNTLRALSAIYFINDNTGWIVGDSAILCKTTNGGSNWAKNTYSQGGKLKSVYFKNQNSGIVGGSINGNLDGFIIKTTDGGTHWSRTDFTGVPYDVFSFGGDTVWSSRHNGEVMKSTNLGGTWISTFVHLNLELYTIYFINNLTGWTGGAVFQEYAYIYKTTDGGITWYIQFISPSSHFFSIYFINDMSGFAATLGGTIYETTNAGIDWIVKLAGANNTLIKIRFPVTNIGYAVGTNRRVLKTTNQGTSWSLQTLPFEIAPSIALYSVNFRNENTGWVIGDNGTILKTTNGGELIGIQNISGIIPKTYRLSQNYPNPFNPATTIEFELPQNTNVKLTVFDITGKVVEHLVDQELSIGSYKITFDGNHLSSGIYYYKINTSNYDETRKFVLVK